MSATPPLRYLTGITTTGTPHLGNYVGAIRPAVQASRRAGTENFYFLADYHALIKCDEPARIQRSTLEIAACWLAAGLDPDQVTFYRQSDIPQIPELTWLLTCVTGKGLLNRAHAYKASVDKNLASGSDPDAEVTAGLFMYPVLMAADIIMFNAHRIPVGRDQVQHIEMARDMAQSFNHLYGEHFVLPEAAVDDSVALLPGLDGRKMSKSYDNVIPLFAAPEQMRRQIAAIVTDSRAPGEPKSVDGSALFQIYQAFASPQETQDLARAYAEGIGWGDAKQLLFERIDREIAPMRARYQHLIDHPAEVEAILAAGAEKARALAQPVMGRLREAVGLRHLARPVEYVLDVKPGRYSIAGSPATLTVTRSPSFKQYREPDGRHYFKLVEGTGRLLLQSGPFASPREAGQVVAQLKQSGSAGLQQHLMPVDGVGADEVSRALDQLKSN